MLNLPERVTVVEVAPRDGLQSFPRAVDTDTKVRMIDRLSATGLEVIEVTGFAHPRVIPNLADAEEVCARIRRRPGVVYRGLAPNARGAERAARAKVDETLGLTIVSDTYLKKNQNMTADVALEEAIKAFRIADTAGQAFVMALGMSMWFPYEGIIAPEKTLDLVRRLRNAGIRRFYLAGSMGMENPRQVNSLFRAALERHPDCAFGYHVHNLSGMGTANILAALDAGATSIEGAICGIGGGIMMPTSMGSVGNHPSEDIVAMLNEMGIHTGVETAAMIAAARDIAAMLDIEPRSYATTTGTRDDVMAQARSNPRFHPG